jgi:hypothetical protein
MNDYAESPIANARAHQQVQLEEGSHAGPLAGTALQRFLRQRLFDRLSGLRHGRLVIDDALGLTAFGLRAKAAAATSPPTTTWATSSSACSSPRT